MEPINPTSDYYFKPSKQPKTTSTSGSQLPAPQDGMDPADQMPLGTTAHDYQHHHLPGTGTRKARDSGYEFGEHGGNANVNPSANTGLATGTLGSHAAGTTTHPTGAMMGDTANTNTYTSNTDTNTTTGKTHNAGIVGAAKEAIVDPIINKKHEHDREREYRHQQQHNAGTSSFDDEATAANKAAAHNNNNNNNKDSESKIKKVINRLNPMHRSPSPSPSRGEVHLTNPSSVTDKRSNVPGPSVAPAYAAGTVGAAGAGTAGMAAHHHSAAAAEDAANPNGKATTTTGGGYNPTSSSNTSMLGNISSISSAVPVPTEDHSRHGMTTNSHDYYTRVSDPTIEPLNQSALHSHHLGGGGVNNEQQQWQWQQKQQKDHQHNTSAAEKLAGMTGLAGADRAGAGAGAHHHNQHNIHRGDALNREAAVIADARSSDPAWSKMDPTGDGREPDGMFDASRQGAASEARRMLNRAEHRGIDHEGGLPVNERQI